MKAKVPTNMQNGVVNSVDFAYTRKTRTLNAYDKEYEIPVRTTEFADKLENVRTAISEAKKDSETVAAMKDGIALFIGAEETERIFPADKPGGIDVDEVIEFWLALNFELARTQNEIIARYAPKK